MAYDFQSTFDEIYDALRDYIDQNYETHNLIDMLTEDDCDLYEETFCGVTQTERAKIMHIRNLYWSSVTRNGLIDSIMDMAEKTASITNDEIHLDQCHYQSIRLSDLGIETLD